MTLSPKDDARRWGRLALWLLLLAPLMVARADTNQPLCKIWLVRVAGRVVPGPWTSNAVQEASLRLRAPARLEFSFAPADEVRKQPLRLRCKLDGLNRDWREAGGDMEVLVITYAASNHILSYQAFPMEGESPNWRGRVEDSEFRFRRETITLPAGAERIEVLLTSQDWNVLGTAAITDLRVYGPAADGKRENLCPDSKIEQGENMDEPKGKPRFWQAGRFGANMTRLAKLPPPAKGHALVIEDNSIHLSANWQADLPLSGRAHAGDTLTIEWREAFSVGIGGRNRATYDPLPPGDYAFRVKTVTPFGQPIGSEVRLAVVVPQVFWKRTTTLMSSALAFMALVALVVWRVARWRLKARLADAERRRRLEHERLRIAQDIHDDLGASLTHINLLSQTAAGKMETEHAAWKDTERLRTLAVGLTEKLDEIVWAVSPRHDTFESLLSYLTDLAEEFLGAANIRVRIHVPIQLPSWSLQSGLRHNVFLATKEALNNIVKHAQATEAQLQLAVLADGFELTIEDNGCGFSPSAAPAHAAQGPARHGLEGVKWRIESLAGKVKIDSAPGRGTRIVFAVPVYGG